MISSQTRDEIIWSVLKSHMDILTVQNIQHVPPLTSKEIIQTYIYCLHAAGYEELAADIMYSDDHTISSLISSIGAKICVVAIDDAFPLPEKPQMMIVELSVKNKVAAYIKLSDRPLRMNENPKTNTLHIIDLKAWGHGRALAEYSLGNLKCATTNSLHELLDFGLGVNHKENSVPVFKHSHYIASVTRPGSTVPFIWGKSIEDKYYAVHTETGEHELMDNEDDLISFLNDSAEFAKTEVIFSPLYNNSIKEKTKLDIFINPWA